MTGRGRFSITAFLQSLIIGFIVVVSIFVITSWWLRLASEYVSPFAPTQSVVNEDSPGESLPPCQTEDSDNCYWDADTMGNGQGHDSIVITELPVPTITDGVNR